MPTPSFLTSLLDLASCDSIDALLETSIELLDRELGVRGCVELWDDQTIFARGEVGPDQAARTTWIGIRYTIGAVHLERPPSDTSDVELVARQLAPLAERLLEYEHSHDGTLRDEIRRVYDRRIREELVRCDGNASAVARNLSVSRNRVAAVARRWTRRRLAALR